MCNYLYFYSKTWQNSIKNSHPSFLLLPQKYFSYYQQWPCIWLTRVTCMSSSTLGPANNMEYPPRSVLWLANKRRICTLSALWLVNKHVIHSPQCLVIGEITSSNMVVVLNKVDQIPEASRAVQIEKVKKWECWRLYVGIFTRCSVVISIYYYYLRDLYWRTDGQCDIYMCAS